MSKQTQWFFEQLKNGEQPKLAESIQEAAGALKSIGGQLWDGVKPMFDHGRTELAAALFAGHAHVMYMKGQEGQGLLHGQDQQGQEQAKQAPEQQQAEQQRGGREM